MYNYVLNVTQSATLVSLTAREIERASCDNELVNLRPLHFDFKMV